MQLRRWNYSQGIGRRSPAGNTGDRMPPMTPTPGVSEAPLPVGILSGPSLAGGLIIPAATSCTVSAHVDRLSCDKSSGTPPGNAFCSGGGGGMAKREHTLKACSCDGVRRRSWNGARKAPTYLLAPVRLSSARGKDSHREASPCIILTYSNLQQPKADFSSQDPVFPLSWRAELKLNIQ